MQTFGLLSADTLVAEAPGVINESLKTIASDFAGGTFPTTNLFPFMTCYRTDEQKLYRLQADLTTWVPETLDSVPHATNADHATTADSATTATSATNATNATNAQNANNAVNAETAAGLTDAVISALMLKMYPVGSIYASTVSTNPGTLFGGTWEALPAGRVLLAQGTSEWGTEYAAGSTGGEATHTLTIGELPEHSHTRGTMNITGTAGPLDDYSATVLTGAMYKSSTYAYDATSNSSSGNGWILGFDASRSWTGETSSVGNNQSHNIMQPYLSCYYWRRSA